MVKQKMISVKLDEDLVSSLDDLCSEYGQKKNRMINTLVRIGVNNMLGHRREFELISVLSRVHF